MVDQRTLPDDRFGYSVYALVALASPEQVEAISSARKTIGVVRAMIPAHVTVRGTFHSIESLDEMTGLLRETAKAQSPVAVKFSPEGWQFLPEGDEPDRQLYFSIVRCETTPELVALHQAFDAVIRPRSTNAYPDNYLAHLTLCQGCTSQQIEHARKIATGLNIGAGFDITSVQLMGRVGPAFGGEWKLIESFPLGAVDS